MEVLTTILSLQTLTSTILPTPKTFSPALTRTTPVSVEPTWTFPLPATHDILSASLTTEVLTINVIITTIIPLPGPGPGRMRSLPSGSSSSESSAPGLSPSQTLAPGSNSDQSLASGPSPNDPTPGQVGNSIAPTPGQVGNPSAPTLNPTPNLLTPPLFSSTGVPGQAPLQTPGHSAPDLQDSHPRPDTKLALILPVLLISLFVLSVLAYIVFRRYHSKSRSQDPAAIPTPFYISSTTTNNHSIIVATGTTQGHHRSAKTRSIYRRHFEEPSVNSQERLVQRNGGSDEEGNEGEGLPASNPLPEVVAGGVVGDGGRSAPASRADFLDLRARLANIEAQVLPPDYASEGA